MDFAVATSLGFIARLKGKSDWVMIGVLVPDQPTQLRESLR